MEASFRFSGEAITETQRNAIQAKISEHAGVDPKRVAVFVHSASQQYDDQTILVFVTFVDGEPGDGNSQSFLADLQSKGSAVFAADSNLEPGSFTEVGPQGKQANTFDLSSWLCTEVCNCVYLHPEYRCLPPQR